MCRQCKNIIMGVVFNKVGQLAISQKDLRELLETLPKCPAMKALEDLTPSGSEFWEDPKYCYEYVKDARSSTHKLLIKTAGDRNNALARIIELEQQLYIARDCPGPTGKTGDPQ